MCRPLADDATIYTSRQTAMAFLAEQGWQIDWMVYRSTAELIDLAQGYTLED